MARFTFFTKHAQKRIGQRTKLTESYIANVLDNDLSVKVGEIAVTDKVHRLFYSPREKRYFVAIQNSLTGAVITLLPQAYYEHLLCHIGAEKLRLAMSKTSDAPVKPHACITGQLHASRSHETGKSQPVDCSEYTATFYTALARQFARRETIDPDNTRLVLKKPGTAKGCFEVSYGFYLSTNGRLFYNDNRITVLELDALTIGRQYVTFYQCIAGGAKGTMGMQQRICQRRMTILRQIFPQHEVRCVIVSNTLAVLPLSLQSIGNVTLLVYHPVRQISQHKSEKRLREVTDSEAMLPVDHLNYITSDFGYLDKLLAMNSRIACEPIAQVLDSIADKGSIFSRLYWGCISIETASQYLNMPQGINDNIYVSVNVSKVTPKIKFYVCLKNGQFAELLESSVKVRLTDRQRSRQELEVIREQLPQRSAEEFAEFMQAVDEWHSQRIEARVSRMEADAQILLADAA